MKTTVITGRVRSDRAAQDWTPRDRAKAILASMRFGDHAAYAGRLSAGMQRVEAKLCGIIDAEPVCDWRFRMDLDMDALRAARANVTNLIDAEWRAK